MGRWILRSRILRPKDGSATLFLSRDVRSNSEIVNALRIDRLAALYIASPLIKCLSSRRRFVPILMYHSITDSHESGVHAYYRTTTAPDVFAAHMRYLHEKGYRTINLDEAVNYVSDGLESTSKFVVITFDDGYSDFYRAAFPVLNEQGFSATVFLPTAFVGETQSPFKGRSCLTWREVRELLNNGILFGSHTVTHPQLSTLPPKAVNQEIVDSKRTIEDETGCAVESFAYPYAFPETDHDFTKRLREQLSAAGYKNGVCTALGTADSTNDPFFMKRLPVNSWDDQAFFAAKLNGAYDWLAKPQYLVKTAKRWAGGLSSY